MKALRVLFLGVLISLIGCTQAIDFKQIDDANVFSSYLFTLVYFDVDADFFLGENDEEVLLIKDVFELPISGKSQDYIEKVEFEVVVENTFDREISFQIVFFDLSGIEIYKLQPLITVSAKSPETTFFLEIPKEDLNIIYSTEQVGFELTMSPATDGTVLSTNDLYNFKLKSAVEIFVNLGNL